MLAVPHECCHASLNVVCWQCCTRSHMLCLLIGSIVTMPMLIVAAVRLPTERKDKCRQNLQTTRSRSQGLAHSINKRHSQLQIFVFDRS